MIDMEKTKQALEVLWSAIEGDNAGDHMLSGADRSAARRALAALDDIFTQAATRKPQIPLRLFG